jgi:hypothetical protein
VAFVGGTLQMPKPEDPFPDLAKYMGWEPLSKTPLLVGMGEEKCQMNEVDLAKRLQKPRPKTKDKKASGEGQSVDLGQRKQDSPSLTKSPARKAEHQEKHDEVQGISTVLRTRKKDKKATGEAHAVQEQDNPLQTKSPAMTQDKQHKKNDGAHTTAALAQGSEFVPSMEHIAPFIPSFKKDFQKCSIRSSEEKSVFASPCSFTRQVSIAICRRCVGVYTRKFRKER